MMEIILKNKLEEKDRVPPKSAQDAAKKVLEWKEKYKSEVKGMTETGWRRARQIAAGKPLALETIKKISQFTRHEKNKTIKKEFKSTPWKDNGYVAWLGWGGDTAILTWSKKVIEKAEREKKQNPKKVFEILKAKGMLRPVVAETLPGIPTRTIQEQNLICF